ncbi:MAG: GTP-binding protein [Hyphomicrobiales bacterium]|nr:GTP-binding protein [Hyphomicrobiales bacterium]
MRSAKIMLLGSIGVGKTSLARRFVFDKFEGEYKSTIGVDIHTHDVSVEGAPMRLILWDTDGDFGSRIFATAYVRGAAGAVIVSDATRPATLTRAAELARAFSEHFPGRPVRIVVNKIDAATLEPEAFAGTGLAATDVLRVSARTGEGVPKLFEGIGAEVLRRNL